MKTRKTKSKKPKEKFVIVQNKFYGKKLIGKKIYYEGLKPSSLGNDGGIKFGKHILEQLELKFGDDYKWIITKKEDSIKKFRNKYIIKTSIDFLSKLNKESWSRGRDIKNDIVRTLFSINFPSYFEDDEVSTYVPGTISRLLQGNPISKLSSEDKDALNDFLPDYISSESTSSVNLLKAEAQIESLKNLAKYIKTEIKQNHAESWWQKFIKSNILIIQQGYIKALDKMNVSIGDTKFPDFSLVTHDSYLDILEIKKPLTNLIKSDDSRGNYYWDPEMSKAIIQVENYISGITKHCDSVRNYLRDKKKIDLQVVRPRGIILAGNTNKFKTQKEKDDFRLLSQSLKNITVLTYDELLIRLENYIKALNDFKNKK